jgi:hypothetical protein
MSRFTLHPPTRSAAHAAVLRWLEHQYLEKRPVTLSPPLLRWLIEHLRQCGGASHAA